VLVGLASKIALTSHDGPTAMDWLVTRDRHSVVYQVLLRDYYGSLLLYDDSKPPKYQVSNTVSRPRGHVLRRSFEDQELIRAMLLRGIHSPPFFILPEIYAHNTAM